ncbi:MAG: glycosyltransferase family 2 protein [Alphaproteobacteria bacterium]|nr:glycosyltransferase family 2 protein [Alphaproteobacteria bacterium]
MTDSNVDISFVFPCFNEEGTIKSCVQELEKVIKKIDAKCEIIISDNGSTDKSLQIAEKLPVRIVHTKQRGYGAALRNGFKHSYGRYIAFADIDGSYPLEFLPKMYAKALKTNADMVIASRMTGNIEDGAMPWLHRHLGTPVLTWLINLLFRGKLSDCNSGFRLMKKTAYNSWHTSSDGMEFASELLIKALKHKAEIVEIPAGLRVDKRDKPPHLSTWRDGMRHLMFILSECPKLFELSGLSLLIVFSLLFAISVFMAPLRIGRISVLNYHTQIACIICSILGMQLWMCALTLYVLKPQEHKTKLSNLALTIREDKLFYLICAVVLVVGCGLLRLFYIWYSVNFAKIDMLYDMLIYVYLIAVLGGGATGLLVVHIVKKLLKIN